MASQPTSTYFQTVPSIPFPLNSTVSDFPPEPEAAQSPPSPTHFSSSSSSESIAQPTRTVPEVAQPTPLPNHSREEHVGNNSTSRPHPKHPRPPLLRFEIRDLSSPGTQIFLRTTNVSTVLSSAVQTVTKHLYTSLPPSHIPPTRSITLVLRSMPGVAYTTRLDLDDDHKEIHLSTDYISGIGGERQAAEIEGVIVHETVHCLQHSASGTAPGGLIEGIADWVRLKAGLAPPHWKRRHDGEDWDRGYDLTAFFLEWLEGRYGGEIVRVVNEGLRKGVYKEDVFWKDCCGKSVGDLWKEYGRSLKDGEGEGEGRPVPTCRPGGGE